MSTYATPRTWGWWSSADGRTTCCRHAPRHHLSTGRQMIGLATTLAALFLLTVLPTATCHPRSYSAGIDQTASMASNGTANRTANTLKRTAPQTNRMLSWTGPSPLATSATGRVTSPSGRRILRPQRVHHHRTGDVRVGRNTGGFVNDQIGASTHKHHSKSIDRVSTVKQHPRLYKNIQQGSVTLEMGSQVFLEPDQNRTLVYSSKQDTAMHRQRTPFVKRKNGRQHHGSHHRVKVPGSMISGGGPRRNGLPPQQKFTNVGDLCISCPPERTAIARKGLDGVMIEPPCLSTCNGRPISKELYELETLFGPRANFVLPHSNGPPYSFMAKVVSKQTGNTVLTCDLRYRVIVKQCKRYKPKNRDLKVSCSLGNIWGSRCTFHCRSGGYLSRPNSFVECGEDELWEGEEPFCTFNDVSDDYAADSDTLNVAGDCQLDIPPENGRFACDLKDNESASNELAVPNGTACQVKWNDGYHIPGHLQPATYFGCNDGRWNNTMRHFCYKPTPMSAGNNQRRRVYG
uniref:Sushi domain-containing protein n=1 Tax=Anopheles funestus TaxID=62324 RepID=A0A182R6M0_ANOFN